MPCGGISGSASVFAMSRSCWRSRWIGVSYETIRFWMIECGRLIAANLRRGRGRALFEPIAASVGRADRLAVQDLPAVAEAQPGRRDYGGGSGWSVARCANSDAGLDRGPSKGRPAGVEARTLRPRLPRPAFPEAAMTQAHRRRRIFERSAVPPVPVPEGRDRHPGIDGGRNISRVI